MSPSPVAFKDLLELFKIALDHQIGIEPVRNPAKTEEKLAINALIRINGYVA